jgi:hypothetical protein
MKEIENLLSKKEVKEVYAVWQTFQTIKKFKDLQTDSREIITSLKKDILTEAIADILIVIGLHTITKEFVETSNEL